MQDIAKCNNEKCDKAKRCYRFMAPQKELQVWAYFDDNNCEYFISIKENK